MQFLKKREAAHPIETIATFLFLFLLAAPFSYAAPGDETTYYLLTDHLASIDVVLDEQGDVVERRDFLPYGKQRVNEFVPKAPQTDHKFTGKEFDSGTGLHYYGARYYDSEIGRFTTIDPLVLDQAETTNEDLLSILENPQKLNAYGYALNNPQIFVDLFGESAEAMAGFGRMIDGGIKTVTGFAAGYYASPAKVGGVVTVIGGTRDLMSGFVLATTENESPEFTGGGKKLNTAIDLLSLRKMPLKRKVPIKTTINAGTFEREFRKLGEFAESAGEKFGNMVKDITFSIQLSVPRDGIEKSFNPTVHERITDDEE